MKPQYVDQIPKTVKVCHLAVLPSFPSAFLVLIRYGFAFESMNIGQDISVSVLQGSIGSILSRKDDTKTEAVVCEQLGKCLGRFFFCMQCTAITVL